MSSDTDKRANRAAFKQRAWNTRPVIAPTAPLKPSSWWMAAAAPDARESFIELAKARDRDPWTNIVPHAMNTQRGEFG